MVNLIDSIKSNPIAYYVGLIIGIALLSLVIYLIARNQAKKKQQIVAEAEERARIEKQVDLEAMIAEMQEQEQIKNKDIDPVEHFEQEQEEKAIISYQELVNAVKAEKKDDINVINVNSNGEVIATTNVPRNEIAEDTPIFIDEIKLPKAKIDLDDIESFFESDKKTSTENDYHEVEDITNNIEVKENNVLDNIIDGLKINSKDENIIPEVEEFVENKKEEKKEHNKFKSSEFISPIYGRQNSNISYPKISSLKKDDATNDLIFNTSSDNDINDEFLNTLRQFRNN